MKIIENVKFNQLERTAFALCRPAFFMMESELNREVTEEERKSFNTLLEGNSLSVHKLYECLEVLRNMFGCATKRMIQWESIIPTLPENADGLIMKPRMMAEAIVQGAKDASRRIGDAIRIVEMAIDNMKDSDRLVPGTWEDEEGE